VAHAHPSFQVLADQAVWAVCGRAAAVIDATAVSNEDGGGAQEVRVEVMPLVGGHLRLPKVRISRYISATAAPGGKTDGKSKVENKDKCLSREAKVVFYCNKS